MGHRRRKSPQSSAARALPAGLFTRAPREIAEGLFRAAKARRGKAPYRAAMSMLNFYVNRAGRGLTAADRRRLDGAKSELRKKRDAPRTRVGAGPGRAAKTGPVVELVRVARALRGPKKFTAQFLIGGRPRTTHFGAKGYEDFTTHHDRARRDKYRRRHQKDLQTRDPTRAGFLSYYLLWGPSVSLARNVAHYRRMLKSGDFGRPARKRGQKARPRRPPDIRPKPGAKGARR
jgi:hypothetical protein